LKTQKGVTLVELLVVLVIMAVALSMVSPSMSNSYENWQLRSTGRQVLATLRFASQTARREAVNLTGFYRDHQFFVIRNGVIVKQIDIPESVTLEPAAPLGAAFLPTGQILAAQEFTLTNKRGRKMTIRFGPMAGQLSLSEGTP
jgi:prepilin-type N-terminal cleavage/methylation domain-containing protein